MNVRHLVEKMTLEEKAGLCSGLNWFETKPVERLNIPKINMYDGPTGLRKNMQSVSNDSVGRYEAVHSTCFPTGAGMAATWNTELIEEAGRTMGKECQAEHVSLLLGPAMNTKRTPLGGRNFEYLSEDPYLAGKLAAAHVRGVQSQGIGACLKHFAANNEESRRLSVNAVIDERTLREIYLTAFEIAVKESAPWTIMCAYNRVNGKYASQNRHLLTEILRDEWGYQGIVMSDWGATKDRVDSLKAGLDLQMPGCSKEDDQLIVDAVRAGELPESVLDETARRMLECVYRVKECEKENASYDKEAHHRLARRVAAESMVLLKNENAILPLQKSQNICLIGEMAVHMRCQGGGSSHVTPYRVERILDEIVQYMPQIQYAQGYRLDDESADSMLLDEAVAMAARSETAVIFAGLPDSYEAEGYDRTSMHMPQAQNELIEAVASVNSNVVVVLFNGAPMEMPWNDRVRAVLEANLGGEAAAGAVCDLLFGAVNPCGKLAETIPLKLEDNPTWLAFDPKSYESVYAEGIYVGYRYYDKKKMPVRYPFGHGLSYTSFAYNNIAVDTQETDLTSSLEVTAEITNIGERAGKEIVQLYIASGLKDRPVRELKGFAKVELKPGETKKVSFTLDQRSFAMWSEQAGAWYAENGTYGIEIGASSRDIRLKTEVSVVGQKKPRVRVTEDTAFSELISDVRTRNIIETYIREPLPHVVQEMHTVDPDKWSDMAMTIREARLLTKGAISMAEVQDCVRKCNIALGFEEE